MINEELLHLAEENPIRKLSLYKSTEFAMVYEVGRKYGGGKLIVSAIEVDGDRYFVFVNKRSKDGELDTADYLWKSETSQEISVEYDLGFDEL